ncbi:hypothetical protein [Paenibacillus humicola]|uniref:hypothetical protein n=1 Tax=Paenibacillus humicola TaxID=3110540 RepID=UPI00237AD659|nr:hypothetical protein [Paenibacillus humicola]
MSLEQHVGSILRIVYMDRNNRFTKRTIHVLSIADGRVRAYCLTSKGHRVFRIDHILAFEAVKRLYTG